MQMRQGSFWFKAEKNMYILTFGISATDVLLGNIEIVIIIWTLYKFFNNVIEFFRSALWSKLSSFVKKHSFKSFKGGKVKLRREKLTISYELSFCFRWPDKRIEHCAMFSLHHESSVKAYHHFLSLNPFFQVKSGEKWKNTR